MNIAALQATLRQFAADRHWQPFQTPKNLAMALVVEAAELVEIFQWMTAEQSQLAHRDAAVKQHIGEEIADVLVYLLQIADHSHIDVQRAVDAKLVLNARKYPPSRPVAALPPPPVSVAAEVATPPLGRTHVLLDFENVQPDAEALRALVPDLAQVWLFHGPQQKDPGKRLAGLPVTLVPISKTGKNALDFHLTFYVGYIMSRHPDDKIVVVANDRGYEPMLMHARTMGFDVRLQTHVPAKRTAAAKKPAPARKQPAAKAVAPPAAAPAAKAPTRTRAKAGAAAPAPAKPVAAKKAVGVKPPPKPVAAKKVVARKVAVKAVAKVAPAKPAAPAPAASTGIKPQVKPQKLLENLRKMGEQRPTSRAPLVRVLQSYMGSGATLAAVEAALEQLAAAGFLTVTPAGRVRYAL